MAGLKKGLVDLPSSAVGQVNLCAKVYVQCDYILLNVVRNKCYQNAPTASFIYSFIVHKLNLIFAVHNTCNIFAGVGNVASGQLQGYSRQLAKT